VYFNLCRNNRAELKEQWSVTEMIRAAPVDVAGIRVNGRGKFPISWPGEVAVN
jgi:hypothetical protein